MSASPKAKKKILINGKSVCVRTGRKQSVYVINPKP